MNENGDIQTSSRNLVFVALLSNYGSNKPTPIGGINRGHSMLIYKTFGCR